jgi:hypothetical protein
MAMVVISLVIKNMIIISTVTSDSVVAVRLFMKIYIFITCVTTIADKPLLSKFQ